MNMAKGTRRKTAVAFGLGAAALAALVWAALGGAVENGFVYFDDDKYVFENKALADGLTWGAVRWAFAGEHAANWHPLTWLSHALDITLFGMDAGWHHGMNVGLHAANALLVWWALRRLTGRRWLAWAAAALWAVHPLRVESVAWASERKDVLAAFFALWAMVLHGGGRWATRRQDDGTTGEGGEKGADGMSLGRRAGVAALFALSLMAKPSWVTLPFGLLVADFWPLGRWRRRNGRRLWAEKAELFALAGASCAATMAAQTAGGAVWAAESLSAGARVAHAAVSVWAYLRMWAWPKGLAVLYPYPWAGWPWWGAGAAIAGIVAVCGLFWTWRRESPWWLAGWLWFLGTLVPMSGLVQVGRQAWADRYMYVPQLGLSVALCWGVWEGVKRMRGGGAWGRRAAVAGLAAALAAETALSARQVRVWKDHETLFRHALEVTENNDFARGTLGIYYGKQGRTAEALECLEAVAKTGKADAEAWSALGLARWQGGDGAGALAAYRRAAAWAGQWEAMNNLAWLLATESEEPCAGAEAVEWARRALEAAPAGKEASPGDTLAAALARTGDYDGAGQAAERAADAARRAGDAELAERIEERAREYGEKAGGGE